MLPAPFRVWLAPPLTHGCLLSQRPAMCDNWGMDRHGGAPHGPINVFLADDNLIVREGVRALIERP